MITGLSRIAVPVFIISIISVIPSFFSRLNSAINTIPFNTATPNSAIKPTPAEILKGIPLNQSAKIPPTADKGIAVKINNAFFKDAKLRYNRKKISKSAAGTATSNLAFAASKFSNVPP